MWAEFIVAILAFFLSHTVPVRPNIRVRLVERLGPRGFTLCYSALSLAVLVWVIGAAGRAPNVVFWSWSPWQNYVVLVAMGVVCVLLALSIGRPNPFSFGGARNDMFDPTRPGIVRYSRHPLLLALCLWAFAHLVPNGDAAHVLLFGIFGSFAVLGHQIIDRRKQRQMGTDWTALYQKMQGTRFLKAPLLSQDDGLRLILAGLLYGLLLWAHPRLFGVNPIA